MTRKKLLAENEQLRDQFSAAWDSQEEKCCSRLTTVEEKLRAEITSHLEDKRKIIQQKELSELIVESISIPFCIIDAIDFTIKAFNSAAESKGDYPKNTTCYKYFHNRAQPCQEPELICPVEKVRKTGKPCVVKHFHRDENDKIVQCFEIHAHPIFDREGNLIQVVISVIDIAERKRIEYALRQSESRYRNLFQNIPIGMSIASLDGQIIHFNKAMSQLTGYTEEELSSMNIREFFQDSKEYELLWTRQKENGSVHHTEVQLIRKDGAPFFVSLTVTRIEIDSVDVALFSAIDITLRKNTEAELRKTMQVLEEQKKILTRKNVALSELVDQIAIEKNMLKHDIGANVCELVLPVIEKLRLTEAPSGYLDLLEHHIRKITDKFGVAVSKIAPRLSPRESEILTMIHSGLTSKDIARLLNISYQTVEKHRRNIRKKIGISGKKVNLSRYLE
jgi:PAS domain S-box-containing protein